jgi:hypothetical protein
MPEGDAAKPGDGKDYSGVLGFVRWLGDFLYKAPVWMWLLLLGLAAIVFWALGGIPKFFMFSPEISHKVLIVGLVFLVGSIVLGIPSSLKPSQNVRRAYLIFPFLALAMGIVFSLVLVLSHLGILPASRSDVLRNDLEEIVIGLAMATWCGFIPVFLGARILRDIPTDIKSEVETLVKGQKDLLAETKTASASLHRTIEEELIKLRQTQTDLLKNLKDREDELVNHVEDATRRLLSGFDAVFARALCMVTNAQTELIFVNFAINFGSPHCYNAKIVERYAENNQGADMRKDVDLFLKRLRSKVVDDKVPRVQILTVSQRGTTESFLNALASRPGYEELEKNLENEGLRGAESKRDILKLMNAESNSFGGGDPPKAMYTCESLPIQLLITGVPTKDSVTPRFGCLVFMVGTEILKADMKPGSEPAFYTELDSMVEVFRTLALALINSPQTKRVVDVGSI